MGSVLTLGGQCRPPACLLGDRQAALQGPPPTYLLPHTCLSPLYTSPVPTWAAPRRNLRRAEAPAPTCHPIHNCGLTEGLCESPWDHNHLRTPPGAPSRLCSAPALPVSPATWASPGEAAATPPLPPAPSSTALCQPPGGAVLLAADLPAEPALRAQSPQLASPTATMGHSRGHSSASVRMESSAPS